MRTRISTTRFARPLRFKTSCAESAGCFERSKRIDRARCRGQALRVVEGHSTSIPGASKTLSTDRSLGKDLIPA
jgi:hypothetical protein